MKCQQRAVHWRSCRTSGHLGAPPAVIIAVWPLAQILHYMRPDTHIYIRATRYVSLLIFRRIGIRSSTAASMLQLLYVVRFTFSPLVGFVATIEARRRKNMGPSIIDRFRIFYVQQQCIHHITKKPETRVLITVTAHGRHRDPRTTIRSWSA